MAENAVVRSRVSAEVKEQATAVLEDLGLSVSDLMRITLTRVAKEGAIPFDLNPNKLTRETLRKSATGRGSPPRQGCARLVRSTRHLVRIPEYSTQFRRDVKRAEKRGKNIGKLKELLALLISGDPLPANYKDHPLKQNWDGYRDAHVEPDWLLIYTLVESGDGLVVRFERTGTHSDLFD